MKSIKQSSRRAALSAAAGISLVLALSAVFLPSLTALGAAVPDVNGTYDWTSLQSVVVSGQAGAAFWQIDPEGPIMHLTCLNWGTVTLVQSGSSFTATGGGSGECTTQGGQTVQVPFSSVSGGGFIRGHNITFQGEGFCSWQGSLSAENGVATAFHTVGGCSPPISSFPFHPLRVWDVNFDGVRYQ